MKIEEGKFYRTRDGRKIGNLFNRGNCWATDDEGVPGHYTDDGISAFDGELPRDETRNIHDLIAEWVEESPIRTVTRREIVPGRYGSVHINSVHPNLDVEFHVGGVHADTLRAAAKLFNELADVLAENAVQP